MLIRNIVKSNIYKVLNISNVRQHKSRKKDVVRKYIFPFLYLEGECLVELGSECLFLHSRLLARPLVWQQVQLDKRVTCSATLVTC